jgi:hypothetical protein
MVVRGRAGGLHDENILTTDVLIDLHKSFAIRKGIDCAFAQFHADGLTNGQGKRPIGCPAEDFHIKLF